MPSLHFPLPLPVPAGFHILCIQCYGYRQGCQEKEQGEGVDYPAFDPQRKDALQQVLHIGIWQPGCSKLDKYFPVPVGKRTITNPVKNSQDEPGQACEGQGYQVKYPGLFPDPAEKIEKYQAEMKDEEEPIEKVQHAFEKRMTNLVKNQAKGMEVPLKHLNIKVSGKVQGVAFRYAARSTALTLGVYGFVKNLPDGSVYIEAEGGQEQVDAFVAWCRQGPSRARIDTITIIETAVQGFNDFEIRY